VSTQGPLHVMRRRWASIVVVTLLAVLGGLAYALTAPVTYKASASDFFSLRTGNSADDLVQGSTYTQNQVESFARLATTPQVLQPVVDRLGLPGGPAALAAQVDASVPVGTVIVEVTVTDSSPQRSAVLANAVISSLSGVVEDIAPRDDAGRTTVVATTVASAEVPTRPASPNLLLDLAIAAAAGLTAGLALAWIREALDTRVRDAGSVAGVTELPVIGSVPSWSGGSAGQVVMASMPHSPHAESFRQLRTNLQFILAADDSFAAAAKGAHVVSVTSSLPGEGKSTMASNLAVAIAETGARVLLVDADLRRPSVAGVLGLEGAVGLSTVLAQQAALDHVVQEWGAAGLHVLPSGPVPPNPAELLGSPAMRRLVEDLRRRYDYVIIDTAPLLPVADATVLSRLVDDTLVVAHARRIRRAQLSQALGNLEQVSAGVMGIVLNRVRGTGKPYAYRGEAAQSRPSDTGATRPGFEQAGAGIEQLPVG
jgi:polysaccharide biosynthesis transport protein